MNVYELEDSQAQNEGRWVREVVLFEIMTGGRGTGAQGSGKCVKACML